MPSTSPSPASAPARRTNAERTAETRAKLLEAASASLAELGYARTSTTEIARRAGVSRGAQLHHFPTKSELVVAACGYVLERRVEEFRAIITAVPQGADRIDAAIDVLSSIMQGPSFDAWFELLVASRTDPDLRPHMAAMSDRLTEIVGKVWDEIFPMPPDSELGDVHHIVPALFFSILDGLALQRIAGSPRAETTAAEVLMVVKSLGRIFVAAARDPAAAATLEALAASADHDLPPIDSSKEPEKEP
jgi:AcrR family transcriptional regulator